MHIHWRPLSTLISPSSIQKWRAVFFPTHSSLSSLNKHIQAAICMWNRRFKLRHTERSFALTSVQWPSFDISGKGRRGIDKDECKELDVTEKWKILDIARCQAEWLSHKAGPWYKQSMCFCHQEDCVSWVPVTLGVLVALNKSMFGLQFAVEHRWNRLQPCKSRGGSYINHTCV